MEANEIQRLLGYGKNLKQLDALELALSRHDDYLIETLHIKLAELFQNTIIPSTRRTTMLAIGRLINGASENGQVSLKWKHGIPVMFSWNKTALRNGTIIFRLNATDENDEERTTYKYGVTGDRVFFEVIGKDWA